MNKDLCCSKEMKDIQNEEFIMNKKTESLKICMKCGNIREISLYHYDDEELLSFLENHDLKETLLYYKTQLPDEYDLIIRELNKEGILTEETISKFEDDYHCNLTTLYGLDNTDKDKEKQIKEILKKMYNGDARE